MFYFVASSIVRGLMGILTRLEVSGVESVPLEGPLLVVANHLHFVDPPLLGGAVPRKVIFMAKSEVFSRFPLGLIVRAYEAFSVRRGEGDTGAIRRAIKVLASGGALGMFPEGHRSKDGKLLPGRPGAAMIALRTHATILPVGISGTRTFLQWPRILNRPPVVVTIGKPFRPDVNPGLSSREQQAELTDVIMRRIAELLPAEQRGIYGDRDVAGLPRLSAQRPIGPRIAKRELSRKPES